MVDFTILIPLRGTLPLQGKQKKSPYMKQKSSHSINKNLILT